MEWARTEGSKTIHEFDDKLCVLEVMEIFSWKFNWKWIINFSCTPHRPQMFTGRSILFLDLAGVPFIALLNGRFHSAMICKHVVDVNLELMLVRMTSFADKPPG